MRDKFYGVIKDDNVNGLRIRKGNILIGDNQTFDKFFAGKTQTRGHFNRYFIGEIYVFDDDLIPNGRRDNFEENGAYSVFKQAVEPTITKLRQLAYDYSKDRSIEKQGEVVHKHKEIIGGISAEVTIKDMTEARKEQPLQKLKDHEQKLEKVKSPKQPKLPIERDGNRTISSPKKTDEIKTRISALKESSILKEKLQTVNSLPPVILMSHLTVQEVINRVFEVIDRKIGAIDKDLAKELKDSILEELENK